MDLPGLTSQDVVVQGQKPLVLGVEWPGSLLRQFGLEFRKLLKNRPSSLVETFLIFWPCLKSSVHPQVLRGIDFNAGFYNFVNADRIFVVLAAWKIP